MEEQPIATVVNQPTPPPPEEVKKGNSTLWVIVIVVLVVVVIAGAYWYMSSQNQTATTQGVSLETLNNDLDTVDEAGIDSDFAEVDKDLQGL